MDEDNSPRSRGRSERNPDDQTDRGERNPDNREDQPSTSEEGGGGAKRKLSDEGDRATKQRAGDGGDRPQRPGGAEGRRDRREEIVHTRPKNAKSKIGLLGDGEKQVKLYANYFKLMKQPTWQIYKYHIEFEPEVVLLGLRRALIAQHKDSLLGGYLFDGMQIFILNKLDDVLCLTSKSRDETEYHLTLKLTKTVDMASTDALQILNLIQRLAIQKLKLSLVGRNYFDANAKIDLQNYPIELWPGYATSIRCHEDNQILMCAEITHKVMRKETLLDIIKQEFQRDRANFQDNAKRAVLGQTVLTKYNNTTYRVDDIDFDTTPASEFQRRGSEKCTFVQYYQQRWHQTITDEKQPMLVTKTKARGLRGGQDEIVLLVPELCFSTGITDRERTDFNFMRAMADHTRVSPAPRVTKLMAFNQRLQGTPESMTVLREWQLELDRSLVQVDARQLKKQDVFFGKGIKITTNDECDWTNSLRNNPLYHADPLERWFIIHPNAAGDETRSFMQAMKRVAEGLRYKLNKPRIHEIANDRQNTYVEAIQHCANSNPQMIVCVLMKKAADSYASIKKLCCVDRAIPTQVICQRTMKAKNNNPNSILSVATKVVIQMACKLGGAAWHVTIPIKGLMTIGFDVCSDSRNKKISYGALVANMVIDGKIHFFSCVSTHAQGEELSNHFSENIVKALRNYVEVAGSLPAKICIYRDGVGDGQIRYVQETEIATLRERLGQFYKNQTYELIFIIVSKRINTRLFTEMKANPRSGTVIDKTITLPERYDFFLISQHVRQGSVSPTSYNVLVDETSYTASQIQTLTFRYTHLYFNWPGTVRVPSVCQYASKLAFLVSQSIHQAPNVNLGKYLYYL